MCNKELSFEICSFIVWESNIFARFMCADFDKNVIVLRMLFCSKFEFGLYFLQFIYKLLGRLLRFLKSILVT
jgi:hypothetical protein